MAIDEGGNLGWPVGSAGDEANRPDIISPAQFKKPPIYGSKRHGSVQQDPVQKAHETANIENVARNAFANIMAHHGIDPGPGYRDRTRELNTQQAGELENAVDWYRGAHKIASQHPRGTHVGSAVLARLSPGMEWGNNVRAAKDIESMSAAQYKRLKSLPKEPSEAEFKAHRKGLTSALNRQTTNNITQAYELHHGTRSPEEALNQVKIGHFAKAIEDPMDTEHAAIDTRSHDIMYGARFPFKMPRGLGSVGRYNQAVARHKEAGQDLGLRPSEVQALTWVEDKQANESARWGGYRGHDRKGEAI